MRLIAVALLNGLSILTISTAAAQSPDADSLPALPANSSQVTSTTGPNAEWQGGAFLDVGYLNSLNSPSNHLFRSRGTTPRVDEMDVQLGGGYVRKKATSSSRWGVELHRTRR